MCGASTILESFSVKELMEMCYAGAKERRYLDPITRTILYDEVRRLHGGGLGYKRIRRVLEEKYDHKLGSAQPSDWLKKGVRPLRCLKAPKFNEELAYIVGAVMCDGSTSREKEGAGRIKLCTKDDEFLEAFKES